MYTPSSTSVTVEQKVIINGREVLNPTEAQRRQFQQQQAHRVNQAGYGAVPYLVPVASTTTTLTAVPVAPGSSLASNTFVTVTQKDMFGNQHSKLVANVHQAPAPNYTAIGAKPMGLLPQPYGIPPAGNRGPQSPQIYGQPGLYRKS